MCQHSPSSLQAISADALVAASANEPAANNAAFAKLLIAFSLVLAVDSPAVDARGTHGCEFVRDVVMQGYGCAPPAKRDREEASVADQFGLGAVLDDLRDRMR